MLQHSAHNHLDLLIVDVFGFEHYFNVVSFVNTDKISYFIFEEFFEVKLDFVEHLWHFSLADGIQRLNSFGGNKISCNFHFLGD